MRTLNFRALCKEYGVSAKTGYKWKERFLAEGLEGMAEAIEGCLWNVEIGRIRIYQEE